jgi:TolB-like protein/Tfp pilus assembly protein PilF
MEEMPVHRHLHSKRGTVYAYKSELDNWKRHRTSMQTIEGGSTRERQFGSRKAMIAVLPFENLSGDPSQEYLSGGLTEEVISQLGRVLPERLGVIARTSSMHYKDTDKGVAVIGCELGVDYLLEGSIRCCKDHARVTVTLSRATDQVIVWSQSYDRELAGILVLQTDVAIRIAESVTELVTVQPGVHFIYPRKIESEAYEAYLKACRFSDQNTEESVLKAVHYFSQAVRMDPNLGAAHAGLANVYILLAFHGVLPPHEAMPLAKTAALQALQINPNLAQAQAILAEIASVYEWDWDEANERYQMAIELNPKDRTVHHYYAFYLAAMGQVGRAFSEIEIARSLDPHSAGILVVMGDLLRYCGQCEEAVPVYLKALEMDPSYGLAHMGLGLAHEQTGKTKKALSELEIAARMSWDNPKILSALGYAQAVSGYRRLAFQTLQQLHALSAKRYVPPCDIAMVYLGLDNENQTLEFLGRALRERSCPIMLLPLDQRAAPLKSNPRFKRVLNSISLPSATD